MASPITPLGQCFDPTGEWSIRETCKPHWSQSGTVVFITMRMKDSIPRDRLKLWFKQRCDWLRREGVLASNDADWQTAVERLPSNDAIKFHKHFNHVRETTLDLSLGDCPLRNPVNAEIVVDALLKFDRNRYRMGDIIVMPNHIHFLAAFADEATLQAQCSSWQRYTARRINHHTGTTGKLWQPDPFDHLVRSPTQYDYLRKYIQDNPRKAGLKPGEYLHRIYQP